MSNIKYLKNKINAITYCNKLTIQIKNLLIDKLHELIVIITDVNKLDLTTINEKTYNDFGNQCWKLEKCFGEYNKFIKRIFYTGKHNSTYILDKKKVVNLRDMKNIIPTKNSNFINKNDNGDKIYDKKVKPITLDFNNVAKTSSSNKNIIIIPGCFDNTQGIDRVKLCKGLIKDFLEYGQKITHIIVSGRGTDNSKILYKEVDKQVKKQIKINLPKRFVTTIKEDVNSNNYKTDNTDDKTDIFDYNQIDKNDIKDIVKYGKFVRPYKGFTHFKTEAYYMAIEVNILLEEIYKDDSSNKPKIFLEPLASETAANFIFAPFSCLYEYNNTTSDNNDVNETTHNIKDAIDLTTKAFLYTLLKSNLHIISHDYHILRCINTSMQTLRPSLSDDIVSTYGTMNYYCVFSDEITLADSFGFNYFESFSQPYYQLFFDLYGIQSNDNLIYKNLNTIDVKREITKPTIYNDPYTFLFQLVIRLLTYHGLYLDIRFTTSSGQKLDNLILKVYPNILNTSFVNL